MGRNHGSFNKSFQNKVIDLMKESTQKYKQFGNYYDDSIFFRSFFRNICANIFLFLLDKTMKNNF